MKALRPLCRVLLTFVFVSQPLSRQTWAQAAGLGCPEGGGYNLVGPAKALAFDQISYKTWGNPRKEAIVLVHGIGGNYDTWTEVAEALSKDHYVIAYDQRAHGKSAVPDVDDYSSHAMAADLRVLLDGLGVEKAHVVGHSMGGRTVVGFAADYPERVLSVTVEDMHMKKKSKEIEAGPKLRDMVAAKRKAVAAMSKEDLMDIILGPEPRKPRSFDPISFDDELPPPLPRARPMRLPGWSPNKVLVQGAAQPPPLPAPPEKFVMPIADDGIIPLKPDDASVASRFPPPRQFTREEIEAMQQRFWEEARDKWQKRREKYGKMSKEDLQKKATAGLARDLYYNQAWWEDFGPDLKDMPFPVVFFKGQEKKGAVLFGVGVDHIKANRPDVPIIDFDVGHGIHDQAFDKFIAELRKNIKHGEDHERGGAK